MILCQQRQLHYSPSLLQYINTQILFGAFSNGVKKLLFRVLVCVVVCVFSAIVIFFNLNNVGTCVRYPGGVHTVDK